MDLSGDISREDAECLLTKHDILGLSAGERKELLLSFWDYYHTISAAATREYLKDKVPEDIVVEIIEKEVPGDPDNPRYDYLVYLHRPFEYCGARNEYVLERLKTINPEIDAIVGDEDELERCPCCGYHTLGERGMYEICDVCFWEDDGVNEDHEYSGPNHMTLREGRENFRKYGAYDQRSIHSVDRDGPLKYKRS
ncbi:hypothetical protein E2N92_01110 [Methanofollis formosanus]|uniref:Cysteine-rich CPCC domain-containing protein n=2 Tax=Methanofollis formosanus TaxID=299308 RepID=A0A8G1EHJ7_9EURY|nr:hypothetical protein E2N92_01110 [Methanofollis formosanus]